jgi:hypothetical protein
MSSFRDFQPIVLKDGRTIDTVGDARIVVAELHFGRQMAKHWQRASDLLHDAARRKGRPSDEAVTQLRKALKIEGLI